MMANYLYLLNYVVILVKWMVNFLDKSLLFKLLFYIELEIARCLPPLLCSFKLITSVVWVLSPSDIA